MIYQGNLFLKKYSLLESESRLPDQISISYISMATPGDLISELFIKSIEYSNADANKMLQKLNTAAIRRPNDRLYLS